MQKTIISLIFLVTPLYQTNAMLSRFAQTFSKTSSALARTLAHTILTHAEKVKIQKTAEKFARKRTYAPRTITSSFWEKAFCNYAQDQVKNGRALETVLDQWEGELYSDTMFNYFLNELERFHKNVHT